MAEQAPLASAARAAPAPTSSSPSTKPSSTSNPKKHIVVVGAGMAGFLAAQKLYKRKECTVTLISNKDYFIFLPRLTELFGGSLAPEKAILPLRDVWKGELIIERATLVNPEEHAIVLESGKNIQYDTLVLAVGSTTNFFNTQGAQYAYAFYNKEDMERLREHLGNMLSADAQPGTHTIVVVGAGPTGVEVAYVVEALARKQQPSARIIMLERAPAILGAVKELSDDVRKSLERKHIEIMTETGLTNITPLSIEVQHKDGTKEVIPCYTTIWGAGSKPVDLPVTGVQRTDRGELPVEPTMQLKGHPEIYVLGDCAAAGVPKTAQSAVQEATCAAENIEAELDGKPLKPFVFANKGTVIALEEDTVGLFYGKHLSGFLARAARDTYYGVLFSHYK